MIPKIGEKWLITADQWFYCPDGAAYKAVHGTINGVFSAEETLGIKTNSKSTNWYLSVGNTLLAGCQIHYAVKCESFSDKPPKYEGEHEGKNVITEASQSRIYNADK